ncbi:FUSC family protein [Microbacterium sp. STN6]|uniref:FUSC family protein n=1 Tax=Microbacterium sp. STN6 TaxID=2995588 RepID=UPI0022608B5F|nr:FUSC family protein [Microbacterium sp. STN6]MCX7520797.1 FUSC family protein [Microbacterium sp. STN6]
MVSQSIGWVAELLRPKPAPIPWPRVLRTAVAVATPVSVGMAIGQLGGGLVCSIGALAASIADKEGPYRARISRIGIVAASGSTGFALGGLAFGHPLITPLLVLAAALVSGLASVLGNVASVASLQFLIYVIVASGVSFGNGPAWMPPLLYFTGAAWALLLSLSGGIGRTTAPERLAVAEVYRSLAVLMEMSGGSRGEEARRELTNAMNTAYDTVVSYRAAVGGREKRVRRLAALLNAATPLVEQTVALVRSGVDIPLRLSGTVRSFAFAIQQGTWHGRNPVESTADAVGTTSRGPESAELAGLKKSLDAIGAIIVDGKEAEDDAARTPSGGDRLAALRDAVAGGRGTWLPIIRLVICLGIAQLAGLFVPAERPYWIALTVAVTLKPDFGSVFARAVQRGIGTIVGVLIGTALLTLVPRGVPVLAAIALFAAALPVVQRRNYGLFATLLTPVIVLLLDLGHGPDEQLVVSRLLDTSIGCAIVLAFGYLPWPATWRSGAHMAGKVADVADDVRRYVRVALATHDHDRRAVRRHTYRRLADLRVALQQALAEPPLVSRQAAVFWPVIVALERVTDAVTASVIRSGYGSPPATDRGVEQVVAYLREFASAIREGRPADASPLPDEPALDGVVAELRAAGAVIQGPHESVGGPR